jgi:hypothetical protein
MPHKQGTGLPAATTQQNSPHDSINQPDSSVSTLDTVVNDAGTSVDSLAILANDTLALASRSGRRSDARAAVFLHRAVHYAWLAIEELSEGVYS